MYERNDLSLLRIHLKAVLVAIRLEVIEGTLDAADGVTQNDEVIRVHK